MLSNSRIKVLLMCSVSSNMVHLLYILYFPFNLTSKHHSIGQIKMINDPYFNVGGAVIDIFASSLNKDLVLTLLNEMFINVDEFENLSFSP